MLFDVIGAVLESFFDLIPRVCHRPAANEYLVVDTPYGVKETRYPQLYVPAISHCEYYPSVSTPIDCGIQSGITADNQSVSLSVSITVSIFDPLALRTHVQHEDWQAYVSLIVRKSVLRELYGLNLDQFRDSAHQFIKSDVSSDLGEIGVELESLVIEDFISCRHFRFLTPLAGE